MSEMPFKCCNADFTGNSLSIFRGSSWKVTIDAFTRDCGEEEELSLDGYEGSMQIRAEVGKPVLLSPTVTVENNRITLYLSDEETSTLVLTGKNPDEDTFAWYDLFLSKDEDSWKVLQGQIRLVPNITEEETDGE